MLNIVSRILSVHKEHELLAKLEAAGLGDPEAQLVIESKGNELAKKVVDFIRRGGYIASVTHQRAKDGFHIVVDYVRSLSEMIRAGACDWVNSDITSGHFPVKGEGRVELNAELIHYAKFMSSDNIVRDMDSRGLHPATLPELLAFGEKYPEKQREFPIVALGSVWRAWGGRRSVACLCGGVSRRELDLFVWGVGWYGGFRFLAFRK